MPEHLCFRCTYRLSICVYPTKFIVALLALLLLQGGVSYLLASYSAKVCLENYRATSLARQREMTDSAAT